MMWTRLAGAGAATAAGADGMGGRVSATASRSNGGWDCGWATETFGRGGALWVLRICERRRMRGARGEERTVGMVGEAEKLGDEVGFKNRRADRPARCQFFSLDKIPSRPRGLIQ